MKEASDRDLEYLLKEEMNQPIKKFSGLNSVRMCGHKKRLFMGKSPKALIITGCMINIPATYFNAAVAPVPLWDDYRYLILAIGVFL